MNRMLKKKNVGLLLALIGGLVVLVAATQGCGRNTGALPAGYSPEGNNSLETVIFVELDSIARLDGMGGEPVVAVTILDRTRANGYQVYRKRADEDAFGQPVTYVSAQVETFNQGFQIYTAIDRNWVENLGVEYIARGRVTNLENQASPLTGPAVIPPGVFDSLTATSFDMIAPIDTVEVDSLLIIRGPTNQEKADAKAAGETAPPQPLNGFHWDPLPGAVRYLVTCFRSDGKTFIIQLTPPDGSTNLKLEDIQGLAIHQILPLTLGTYFWRVDALDAKNRVIGHTPSPPQIFAVNCRQNIFFGLDCL